MTGPKTNPIPTTATSYALMAPHVPAALAKVHLHAVDAADEALLVAALGLEASAC